MFFRLSSFELGLMLFAAVVGTTCLGLLLGRRMRHHSETLREPLAAMHTALLGLVGLILAFGLALAVGRYETRRTALVDESNTIGTTYLRAQTLAEPVRTPSLETLRRYTDNSIRPGGRRSRERRGDRGGERGGGTAAQALGAGRPFA